MNKPNFKKDIDAHQGLNIPQKTTDNFSKPKGHITKFATMIVSLLATQLTLAQNIDSTTLPSNGHLLNGQATISQTGNTMAINQGSDNVIINWNSFNIGSQASVQFIQPSSNSIALNRVTSNSLSQINGSLSANGQVFLINPSGVIFGQGAQVDVGGLVASTLNISNDNFLSGNYRFTLENSTGGIVNNGHLLGQYIALLAPKVQNEGIISAQQGTVALAGGEAVTLNLVGNRLIDVQVDKAGIDILIENKHLIQVNEGTVIMSAQSANSLISKVVNTGSIEANGMVNDGGVVRLLAGSDIEQTGSITADAGLSGQGGQVMLIADLTNTESQTLVSGSISAKGGSNNGNGGFIETSGSHLNIADSANINTTAVQGETGQWLLDPFDFTVSASNGDITGSTLSTALANNNVTIQTNNISVSCTNATCGSGQNGNGDIFINDSVSWNSNKVLTLNAWNSIEINAGININTAGGGLNLEFAQSDTEFNFPIGGYFINNTVNLAAGTTFTTKYASDGVTTNYTVITDQPGLESINSNMNGNYVLGSNITTSGTWVPLGNSGGDVFTATGFNGVLDGLGHSIDSLTRSNTANTTGVGLFGKLDNLGFIQNLGLTNVNLAGLSHVGAFAGINNGAVFNVYATGSVAGSDVVGANNDESVAAIGGLIGSNSGQIDSSFTNVAVTATTGNQSSGGLIDGGIGGLVGTNDGAISDVYASGNVTGIRDVGGLVGWTTGSIATAFASGTVAGTTNAGGLVGDLFNPFSQPLLFDTYWLSTLGVSGSDGFNSSTQLDATTSKQQSSYSGFDFTNKWVMYEDGAGAPLLKSVLSPIYVLADDTTSTYTGTAFAGFSSSIKGGSATNGVDYSGSVIFTPSTLNPTNVGSYGVTASGLTIINKTDQFGYFIEFIAGTHTINKAALNVTAANDSQTYNGIAYTGGNGANFSGLVNGETQSVLGGSLVFGGDSQGSINAASYAITPSGLTANNYTINFVSGALTINPANLTITANDQSKIYGDILNLGSSAFTSSGLQNSETIGAVTLNSLANLDGSTTAAVSTTNNDLRASNATGGTFTASNYSINFVDGDLAITPKTVNINGLTANDKAQDDNTNAELTVAALSIPSINGDTVTVTGTPTGIFSDSNVGTNKLVTISGLTLAGADAANYSLEANLTAEITVASPNNPEPVISADLQTAINIIQTSLKKEAANGNYFASTIANGLLKTGQNKQGIEEKHAKGSEEFIRLAISKSCSSCEVSSKNIIAFLGGVKKSEAINKVIANAQILTKKAAQNTQEKINVAAQSAVDAKFKADAAAADPTSQVKAIAAKVSAKKAALAKKLVKKAASDQVKTGQSASKTVVVAKSEVVTTFQNGKIKEVNEVVNAFMTILMNSMFVADRLGATKAEREKERQQRAKDYKKAKSTLSKHNLDFSDPKSDKKVMQSIFELVEARNTEAKAKIAKKASVKVVTDTRKAAEKAKKIAMQSAKAAKKAVADAEANPASVERTLLANNAVLKASKDKLTSRKLEMAASDAANNAEDKARSVDAIQSKVKTAEMKISAYLYEKDKKKAEKIAQEKTGEAIKTAVNAAFSGISSKVAKNEAAKANKAFLDKKEKAEKKAKLDKKVKVYSAEILEQKAGIIAQLNHLKPLFAELISKQGSNGIKGKHVDQAKAIYNALNDALTNAKLTGVSTLQKQLDSIKANAPKAFATESEYKKYNNQDKQKNKGYLGASFYLKLGLKPPILAKIASKAAAKEATEATKRAKSAKAAALKAAKKLGATSDEALRLTAIAKAAVKTAKLANLAATRAMALAEKFAAKARKAAAESAAIQLALKKSEKVLKQEDKQRKKSALLNAQTEVSKSIERAKSASRDVITAKATAEKAKDTVEKQKLEKSKWEKLSLEKEVQIPLTAKSAKADALLAKKAMDKFNKSNAAMQAAEPVFNLANKAQLKAARKLRSAKKAYEKLQFGLKGTNIVEIIVSVINEVDKAQKIDAAKAKMDTAQKKFDELNKDAEQKLKNYNRLADKADANAIAYNAASLKAAKSDTAARQAQADKQVADKNVVIFTKNVKITEDYSSSTAKHAVNVKNYAKKMAAKVKSAKSAVKKAEASMRPTRDS